MAGAAEDDLYFDFCHDLVGSESEQRRHVVYRKAFLYLLALDARVLNFFRTITSEAGLEVALSKAVDKTERLADVLGMQRADVFQVADWQSLILNRVKTDPGIVLDAVVEAASAVKEFDSRLVDSARDVSRSIQRFVTEELKLPWPWLSMELLFIFQCEMVSCLCGHRVEIVGTFNPTLPEMEIRIRVAPGNRAQALRKLDSLYGDIRAQIKQGGRRRQCQPNVRKIVRYTFWFYSSRLRGQSIRSLAKQYHLREHVNQASGCSGDRSTIQYGIDECGRILSLTRFTYPDIPSPCRNQRTK